MVTRPVRPRTAAVKKPAVSSSPAPAIKTVRKHKNKEAIEKVKVIRDSFTMPKNDYALIAELKEKALESGLHVKKSEVLRAGLRLLAKASALQLKRTLGGVERIKTGRPKKH
ncbi:MAG: hypothetical protein ACOY3V_04050 [Pseudomonadota bacterium]